MTRRSATTSTASGARPSRAARLRAPTRRTAARSSATFQRSTAEDVALAVEAAARAQRAWREVPVPERGEMLYTVARLLEERKEELAQLMTREMGKVIKEARGDVQEGIDMAKYIAGEGRRFFGQTVPSELRDKFCMTVRQPLGVVGLITPWNFPIAIPCWKTAAGAALRERHRLQAGRGYAGLRHAPGRDLRRGRHPQGRPQPRHRATARRRASRCCEHPSVAVISFTGSTDVGRHIAETCGRNLKRVSLEMGGKNAIVVMNDADLDLVLDGAVWGGFGTAGQRCTASSRLIVQRDVVRDVQEQLVARAEALKIGDGLKPEIELGPVVNGDQLERIHSYTGIGQAEGARLLTGGRMLTENGLDQGYFYAPTVFGNVDPNMRIAQEEIFGPSVSVIPVDTFEQAIEVANGTRVRPLAGHLHARRQSRLPGHRRAGGGDRLRQRADDRGGDSAAVRRDQGDRQRPPRGGHDGHRAIQRDQERLRRLQRHAAARANRQSGVE